MIIEIYIFFGFPLQVCMIKLNEMKKIDLIISLFFLSVIISLTGCDDQSASVVGPVNNYTFEVEDTVVSALSHEFEVGMIDEGYELPRDWSFWRLQIWDNTKPMEEYKKKLVNLADTMIGYLSEKL